MKIQRYCLEKMGGDRVVWIFGMPLGIGIGILRGTPRPNSTGNQSPVQLLVAYGRYEGRAGLFAERELRQKQLLR